MNYNIVEEGIVFDVKSLYGHLSKLKDGRDARGVRYALPTVLVLVVLAKLAGEDEPRGIAEWVKLRNEMLVRALRLKRTQMPHHTTYSRILGSAIDVEEFEMLVGQFFEQQIDKEQRYVVALDGKTMRGTTEAGPTQGVHLLAAYVPEEGVVLMQIEVGSKENEISAAPRIIECLDLRNKVVTGDALLTQRVLSAKIVDAGGDYLWIAKNNQETLRRDIERLFTSEYRPPGSSPLATDFCTASSVDKAHGRLEQRTITVSNLLTDYLDWPHIQQVFKLVCEVRYLNSGKSTRQVFYGLTSLAPHQASPADLLANVSTGLLKMVFTIAGMSLSAKTSAACALAALHTAWLSSTISLSACCTNWTSTMLHRPAASAMPFLYALLSLFVVLLPDFATALHYRECPN